MKALLIIILFAFCITIHAQVAINTDGTNPDNSAMLDVKSTSKGFLAPRMTMAQRNTIGSPATGLMIYQTDNSPGYYYNSGSSVSPFWFKVGELSFPYTVTVITDLDAMSITNIGIGNAIYGEATTSSGTGIFGKATSFTGYSYGVKGGSASSSGRGVFGYASSLTGETIGVRGLVSSPDGFSGYFQGGKFYSDGPLGIGTTNPSRDLSVYGYSLSFANFLTNATGTTSTDGLMIGTGAGYAYLSNYESTALSIGTNGETNILIQPNGNIGIGTTITASYLLDVAGTVNLNKGITSGVALRCNSDEALWYNDTYFSWGYSGAYNFFGNRLKIAGNGNMAPAYELYVDGNAAKSLGGSTWIVSSDKRLKNLIGNYEKGLNEIIQLQPVRFTYMENNPRDLPSGTEQLGFVAQDVQKIFPEAVALGDDGYLDLNMHPVIVALINAIKELNAENEMLKKVNDDLNRRLISIETIIGSKTNY